MKLQQVKGSNAFGLFWGFACFVLFLPIQAIESVRMLTYSCYTIRSLGKKLSRLVLPDPAWKLEGQQLFWWGGVQHLGDIMGAGVC